MISDIIDKYIINPNNIYYCIYILLVIYEIIINLKQSKL